jgi:hypothetical protein
MAPIDPLWLIPAFIAGALVGFFSAYWLALAVDRMFETIRERAHLE